MLRAIRMKTLCWIHRTSVKYFYELGMHHGVNVFNMEWSVGRFSGDHFSGERLIVRCNNVSDDTGDIHL